MAFPTDAAVQQALASVLRVDPSTLATGNYAEICTEANAAAQADLTRILALKGYTSSQITNGWDSAYQYGLDLALFWALTRTGGLGDYPDKFLKALDRREELQKSPLILIGGVPTGPGVQATDTGGISSGGVLQDDGVTDVRSFDSKWFR